jgi:hypothetical protein
MRNQNKKLLENIKKWEERKLLQNRSIRRQVDIDLGVKPPHSSVFKNKKKYNRKLKHKNGEKNNI